MKSKTGIIIAIIVIAALGYWYWSGKETPSVSAPTTATINETADTTADISTDVQNINVGDLNSDFEAIDKDINTL